MTATNHKFLNHALRVIGIAAAYALATIACNYLEGPLSWGPVQLRLSEALCVLALFMNEAIPGLAFGCAIANIANLSIADLGTLTPLGVVLCVVLPLAAALFAWKVRERPVVAGAVLLVVNVAALFVIGNSFGTIGLLDVLLGSLATTLGALFTWKYRERQALALAGPVITNALIIPAYLPFMLEGSGFYTIPFTDISVEGSYVLMYLFGLVAIGLGEAIVMYVLGLPLAKLLKRTKLGRSAEEESTVA